MPELYMLRETLEQLSSGQIRTIPGEALLRPGMSLEQALRAGSVNSAETIRAGDFQGRPGTWVSGSAIDERQPGGGDYRVDRWYADDDHLMYCQKTDMTQMYQTMANSIAAEDSEGAATPKKAARYLQVGTTTTYKRELNAKFPPETFVFTPGDGDRKVDQFVWVIHPGVRDQMAMLGKPAPAITGMDFGTRSAEGNETPPQPVDIGSFKGKVVVLDFWATWCGPCCLSLPSMQMIKEKYADKPFVLIGMNREHAGDERKVLPFLAKRNLTIQQFNDADTLETIHDADGQIMYDSRGQPQQQTVPGKAAAAFFTTNSIPCVVIIDAEGKVADIENGYVPGKEKELMAKLDKLFSGRPVHTPEEIRALNEQVNAVKFP
jgi:thiol-disulfide isomerase/thioredoxin